MIPQFSSNLYCDVSIKKYNGSDIAKKKLKQTKKNKNKTDTKDSLYFSTVVLHNQA